MRCGNGNSIRLLTPVRNLFVFAFAGFLMFWGESLTAQNAAASSPSPSPSVQKKINSGFNSVTLGLSYQAAYDAIVADNSVDYDGIPEVSLSPGREEKIIETRGGRYINRGIFQFRNEKLFSISLEFNPRQLDFYTLFTNFQTRYGEPKTLSPNTIVWDDGSTRLILEYPLTLKYVDAVVIDGILKNSTIQAAVEEDARKSFLERL